jgi:hypothetical protein
VPISEEISIDESDSCLLARVITKSLAPNATLLREKLGENDAIRSCLNVNLYSVDTGKVGLPLFWDGEDVSNPNGRFRLEHASRIQVHTLPSFVRRATKTFLYNSRTSSVSPKKEKNIKGPERRKKRVA